MNTRFAGLLLLASASLSVASGAAIGADTRAAAAKPTAAVEPYAPGLGDFMTAYVQPHHIKLWLAGTAGNWKLAAYEADELTETFEDITTYQPTWKNVPVAQLVRAMIEPAMQKVDAAIAGKIPWRSRTPIHPLPRPATPAIRRRSTISCRSKSLLPTPFPTRISASTDSNPGRDVLA
jgi:hypothetical protein